MFNVKFNGKQYMINSRQINLNCGLVPFFSSKDVNCNNGSTSKQNSIMQSCLVTKARHDGQNYDDLPQSDSEMYLNIPMEQRMGVIQRSKTLKQHTLYGRERNIPMTAQIPSWASIASWEANIRSAPY